MKNKAFTLIELLVVVLIIGILAAIAVPQYQKAVLKSHFSTLKDMTRAIAESVNRYQLATGSLPKSFQDLDITLPSVSSYQTKNPEIDTGVSVYFKDNTNKISRCAIWYNERTTAYVGCYYKPNFNNYLLYTHSWNKLKPNYCGFDLQNNTLFEQICQQETNKTADQAIIYNKGTEDEYKLYFY